MGDVWEWRPDLGGTAKDKFGQAWKWIAIYGAVLFVLVAVFQPSDVGIGQRVLSASFLPVFMAAILGGPWLWYRRWGGRTRLWVDEQGIFRAAGATAFGGPLELDLEWADSVEVELASRTATSNVGGGGPAMNVKRRTTELRITRWSENPEAKAPRYLGAAIELQLGVPNGILSLFPKIEPQLLDEAEREQIRADIAGLIDRFSAGRPEWVSDEV